MNQIDNVNLPFNASNLLDVCPNPVFIQPFVLMPDPNEMPQRSLADRNACALIPYQEPKRFAIEPVQYDPILGKYEFLEKLASLNQEQDVGLLMEVIQRNRHIQLQSFQIIDLLKGSYSKDGSKFSNRGMQILLDKFRPKLDAAELDQIIRLYGFEAVRPIIDLLSQLCVLNYIPYDLDFFLFLFKNLSRDDFVRFFDVHRSYFSNHVSEINGYFKSWGTHFEFAKWLREEGGLAIDLSIFISQFARNGDIEVFQRIVKESKNFELDKAFFKEEILDCLAPYTPVDLSSFQFKPVAIGQNGCRAVVFTEEGEIHSLPGQMASELAKQAGHGSNWDSFQIYLNTGHASIAFKDGHFGFYPKEEMAVGNQADQHAVQDMQDALIENGYQIAAGSSITLGASLGSQPGISSSNQKSSSTKVAQAPLKTWNSVGGNVLSMSCQIKDDSRDAFFSDKANGLKLTVYAPKEKVEAIRQYVNQTKELCDSGSETYHVLKRNCIDFVQRAIEASGIQADFRDAFHTMQYLRRFGPANWFSLLRSSGPMIHEFPNTTLTFDAETVDRIPRSLQKAATAIAIAVPYGYFLKRALPVVKETIVRAAQRIYRASQFAVLTAAAMGTLLFNPARIWRRV